MVTPVSVNPSSATDAASHAISGGGDTSFYFGGNPNAAAIFGNGNVGWWVAGTVVAVTLAAFFLLRHRT